MIKPRRADDHIVKAVVVDIAGAGDRIAELSISLSAGLLPHIIGIQVNMRRPGTINRYDDEIVPAVAVDIAGGNRIAKMVILIFARRLPDGFVLNSSSYT